MVKRIRKNSWIVISRHLHYRRTCYLMTRPSLHGYWTLDRDQAGVWHSKKAIAQAMARDIKWTRKMYNTLAEHDLAKHARGPLRIQLVTYRT